MVGDPCRDRDDGQANEGGCQDEQGQLFPDWYAHLEPPQESREPREAHEGLYGVCVGQVVFLKLSGCSRWAGLERIAAEGGGRVQVGVGGRGAIQGHISTADA